MQNRGGKIMSYKSWMLNAMEEKGYTDTGIDPDTVTEDDLDYIQSRLR